MRKAVAQLGREIQTREPPAARKGLAMPWRKTELDCRLDSPQPTIQQNSTAEVTKSSTPRLRLARTFICDKPRSRTHCGISNQSIAPCTARVNDSPIATHAYQI